jgi:hypothetical protein
MGIPEAMDRCLGHHCFNADCAVCFINTNAPDQRIRMLKPKAALENMGDSDKIYAMSFVDDYYPNRPESLEKFSFFNIYRCFR